MPLAFLVKLPVDSVWILLPVLLPQHTGVFGEGFFGYVLVSERSLVPSFCTMNPVSSSPRNLDQNN